MISDMGAWIIIGFGVAAMGLSLVVLVLVAFHFIGEWATRYVLSMIALKDIHTAIKEWKERNPTKAKKYSGESK